VEPGEDVGEGFVREEDYHDSRSSGFPESVSGWRLVLVTPARKLPRVKRGGSVGASVVGPPDQVPIK